MSNEPSPQQVLDELITERRRLVELGYDTDIRKAQLQELNLKICVQGLRLILGAKMYWSKADLKGAALRTLEGINEQPE